MIEIVKPRYELLDTPESISVIMKILERAGRTCYDSLDKINDKSADKFIRRIIDSGHESVIEHRVLTFVLWMDRSMSHQLVRHRLMAYSQRSQRFVDARNCYRVLCPAVIGLQEGEYEYVHDILTANYWTYNGKRFHPEIVQAQWLKYLLKVQDMYGEMADYMKGEDARSVLPNCIETEVTATGNLRAWRHVFEERALNLKAQLPIRRLMQSVLIECCRQLPVVFTDQYERLQKMYEEGYF